MLNAFDPVALIAGAISPVHLTVAHSLVINIISMVDVSTLPGESSQTILFVVHVLSLKSVTLRVIHHLAPFSLAVLHSVFELARVDTTVLPFIDSFTLGLSLHVVTRVDIAVREDVRAFAMLEAI